MEENKSDFENKVSNKGFIGPWWKPAFEIFSEISTWIAVPIILAVVVGKYLDNRYHTKPWIFIGSVVFAFCISSFGMVKSMKEYARKIERAEKEKRNINK